MVHSVPELHSQETWVPAQVLGAAGVRLLLPPRRPPGGMPGTPEGPQEAVASVETGPAACAGPIPLPDTPAGPEEVIEEAMAPDRHLTFSFITTFEYSESWAFTREH